MHVQAEAELIAKVCNLFQVILHGLHSYEKNMLPQLKPEKLQSFLDLVIEASRICIDKRIFEASDILIKVNIYIPYNKKKDNKMHIHFSECCVSVTKRSDVWWNMMIYDSVVRQQRRKTNHYL